MAQLILSLEGMVLKEMALDKERMTIGRKPHNDLQIDNIAISGEHAAILTILNDSFLEDLDSTNGTLVNGLPVKKHFLRSNDVIELGKYQLKYLNDQTAYDATPPLPPAAIRLLTGVHAGRVLEITKAKTTLGKPGVQVAVITRDPGVYSIAHGEGAQFPIVNGRLLDAQAHQLSDHDVIEIAGVRMEFFLKA